MGLRDFSGIFFGKNFFGGERVGYLRPRDFSHSKRADFIFRIANPQPVRQDRVRIVILRCTHPDPYHYAKGGNCKTYCAREKGEHRRRKG